MGEPRPSTEMSRDPSATRAPGLPPITNLRDFAGHPTRDGGRVRAGRVYRSADLSRLDAAGIAALAGLPVRAVYDLRTPGERDAAPDRLPPGIAYVVADVLAGDPGASPASFAGLLDDPAAAELAFGGSRGVEFFIERYRGFVRSPSARAAYRRLFVDLADPSTGPALVHCTTGKDRTGWAAAALLLWLGVPDDRVWDDYLASTAALAPAFAPALDAFRARGGDPAILEPLIGVRPEYLEAALAEVRSAHGSIEGYVADGLGLDAATRARLREALVERD
jgi:protein-tyrosine phosphatase